MAGQRTDGTPQPNTCRRCKQDSGVHTLRDDPTCNDCFIKYVATKAVKRLEAMNKELKELGQERTPRYAVGLSFGPSSAALLHILHETIINRRRRNSKAVYELLAVHVDTGTCHDEARDLLLKWQERYPAVKFESVPLRPGRPHMWQTLLPQAPIPERLPPSQQQQQEEEEEDKQEEPWTVHNFLASLPSATSRADLLRKLVHQQLLAWAVGHGCSALLLGHSTTALSELALSEVAKGRGFGVSSLISDGPSASLPGDEGTSVPVYRLLREVFRNEAMTYTRLVTPPLGDLLAGGTESGSSAIVSHRDVSVEEVMCRYFDETEKSYPSIIANVVKTIGKLTSPPNNAPCKVCTLPLDIQGEARWEGEICGAAERSQSDLQAADICYGCKRSLFG